MCVQECVERDSVLFYRLLPFIYKQFFKDISSNYEMLNIIVANIDPNQVTISKCVVEEVFARFFLVYSALC